MVYNEELDISTTTVSKIIEIYTHVLGLDNISFKMISLLVESTENLIKDFQEESACEVLVPAVDVFVNALYSIKCKQFIIPEIESTLTTILHLYRFIFTSVYWRYINSDSLFLVIYSMQAMYSNVFVFILFHY